MNLSKRLQLIIDMVPPCDTVADIGTDHGFVPISLVENNVARRAVASDVVPGPLERAREHIAEHGLTEQIDVRLGSGLSTLEDGEADCIIICGMGGLLIADLIAQDLKKAKHAKHLILSPHTEIPALRRYLSKHGFSILDENMLEEDGKYYTVMEVSYTGTGTGKLTAKEIEYGPVLLIKQPATLIWYLEAQIEKNQQILASLEAVKSNGEASPQVEKACREKKREIAKLKSVLRMVRT